MKMSYRRVILVACLVLVGFGHLAFGTGTPELLVDISTVGVESDPGPKVIYNGEVYFAANSVGDGGAGLWKSDGTGPGTVLLKHFISWGSPSNQVHSLTVVGDLLFFVADDEVHGKELWVTDGSPGGTTMVEDINPAEYGSGVQEIVAYDGIAYFAASDTNPADTELWRSDGTPDGTYRVADINETGSSSPREFAVYGGRLFFTAHDGVNGAELWVSDGTEPGTELFKDLVGATLAAGSSPRELVVWNDTLFFSAATASNNLRIWQSDGTPEGTVQLNPSYPPTAHATNLTPAPGIGVFYSDYTGAQIELYLHDGTTTGLVKNLPEGGLSGSRPSNLTLFDGRLFFGASGALYESDGTSLGTKKVPLAAGVYGTESLIALDDALLIRYTSVEQHDELWSTTGWGGTTALVRDFLVKGDPLDCANLNGVALFSATVDGDRELWKTDGTPGGTVEVANINESTADTTFGNYSDAFLVPFDDKLFFNAWANSGTLVNELGLELYATDAAGNAEMLMDINPGSVSSEPNYMVSALTGMFFNANGGTTGAELWASDGMPGGTRLVANLLPDNYYPPGSAPENLTPLTTGVVFSARLYGPTRYPLYFADGTEGGTVTLMEDSRAAGLAVLNSTVYFRGLGELWQTDGTPEGTKLLEDLNESGNSSPGMLTPHGNKLYFKADDGVHGRELWVTDGTPDNAIRLTDINTSGDSVSGSYWDTFATIGDTLFFVADDGTTGPAVWKTNGTEGSTELVKSFSEYSYPQPEFLGSSSSLLFFRVENSNSWEYWATNGTETGTVLLASPGGWESSNSAIVAGDMLFFGDGAEETGAEVWMSDGTPGGTDLLAELYPGTEGSYPVVFALWKGDVYLAAKSSGYGREIHVIRDVAPISARDALDDWANALAPFRTDFAIGSDDLGGNGLPDEAALILAEVATNINNMQPLATATTAAFENNLALLESVSAGTTLEGHEPIAAALMLTGSERLAGVTSIIEGAGISLSGLSLQAVSAATKAAKAADEPYSALGDLDGDLIDNATEYAGIAAGDRMLIDFVEAAAVAHAAVTDNTAPVITLNGSPNITIDQGDAFVDPGATAVDDVDGPVDVIVGGDTVDVNTIGRYTITYDATDTAGNSADQVTRRVEVVDGEAPIIILAGDQVMTLTEGDTYVEPGAVANDNVDGVVHVIIAGDSVDTSVPDTYYVTYDAVDSAGNWAVQVVRTVIVEEDVVEDMTPPQIVLTGPAVIAIERGLDTFAEPGYTATDDTDGDITANVVVGGDTVDPNTAATYVITYDVSDAAGNPAVQATRTVIVGEPLDLCDVLDESDTLLAQFRSDFGVTSHDLANIDPPYDDEAAIELAVTGACPGNGDPDLRDATHTAFDLNRQALVTLAAANPAYPELRANANIIAVLCFLSNSRMVGVRNELEDAGINLSGLTLEAVSCNGACYPAPTKAPSAAASTEPYSAEGDFDGDGISNAVEYQNVLAAGGTIDDFALAATDPDRDGTDVGPPGIAGDVNGDTSTNAIDVQLVINEALGIDTGYSCDINDDGPVNAVDVQLVINAALGIDISGSVP